MRLEAVILPDLGTGPDVPIVVSHWYAARGDEVWEGDRLVEVLVGPATLTSPPRDRPSGRDPRAGRRPGGARGRTRSSWRRADEDGERPADARRPRASPPVMTTIQERSAGVIPFRVLGTEGSYTWSSTRPRCATPAPSGSFPRAGMEPGETHARDRRPRVPGGDRPLATGRSAKVSRRSLSYTYIRRGRKVVKTVTYYLVEVRDVAPWPAPTEHVEDPSGTGATGAPSSRSAGCSTIEDPPGLRRSRRLAQAWDVDGERPLRACPVLLRAGRPGLLREPNG